MFLSTNEPACVLESLGDCLSSNITARTLLNSSMRARPIIGATQRIASSSSIHISNISRVFGPLRVAKPTDYSSGSLTNITAGHGSGSEHHLSLRCEDTIAALTNRAHNWRHIASDTYDCVSTTEYCVRRSDNPCVSMISTCGAVDKDHICIMCRT